MSGDGPRIICRRCGERIPMEGGSCPHCGTSIRGLLGPGAMIVFGLVVGIASLFSQGGPEWFYAVAGLLVAVGGGYLVYERHQRIQEANRMGTGVTGVGDADEETSADVE